MAEYLLLLIVSLAAYLSLFAAFGVAAATGGNDAAAIAGHNIASAVGSSVSEAVGDGKVSATLRLALPADICGLPYMVYPSSDGRQIVVCVNREHAMKTYMAPLELCRDGVSISGFMVGGTGEQRVTYDVKTGTVTLS